MIIYRPPKRNYIRDEVRSRRNGRVLDLRPKVIAASSQSIPQSKPVRAARKYHGFRVKPKQLGVGIIKLIVVGAVMVTLSHFRAPLSDTLIGAYAAAVLVFGIDSQRTFMAALIFLVLVAVFSGLSRQNLAENYAVYAFYFLAIGLFSAMKELLTKSKS